MGATHPTSQLATNRFKGVVLDENSHGNIRVFFDESEATLFPKSFSFQVLTDTLFLVHYRSMRISDLYLFTFYFITGLNGGILDVDYMLLTTIGLLVTITYKRSTYVFRYAGMLVFDACTKVSYLGACADLLTYCYACGLLIVGI